MTFKSRISNSLTGLFGHVLIFIIGGGLLFALNGFQLSEFEWTYLTLLIPYFLAMYIYAGLFNNDIIVGDLKIEIINTVPPFRKKVSIDYSDIKSITLRHDWTETYGEGMKSGRLKHISSQITQFFLPHNYKWIKIDTGVAVRKFYCFGIDYDYYDNEGPLFEDLYKALRERHSSVNWTNDTDPYYAGLIKTTESTTQRKL